MGSRSPYPTIGFAYSTLSSNEGNTQKTSMLRLKFAERLMFIGISPQHVNYFSSGFHPSLD